MLSCYYVKNGHAIGNDLPSETSVRKKVKIFGIVCI